MECIRLIHPEQLEAIRQATDIVDVVSGVRDPEAGGSELRGPLPVPPGKDTFLQCEPRAPDLQMLRLPDRRGCHQFRDGHREHHVSRGGPVARRAGWNPAGTDRRRRSNRAGPHSPDRGVGLCRGPLPPGLASGTVGRRRTPLPARSRNRSELDSGLESRFFSGFQRFSFPACPPVRLFDRGTGSRWTLLSRRCRAKSSRSIYPQGDVPHPQYPGTGGGIWRARGDRRATREIHQLFRRPALLEESASFWTGSSQSGSPAGPEPAPGLSLRGRGLPGCDGPPPGRSPDHGRPAGNRIDRGTGADAQAGREPGGPPL